MRAKKLTFEGSVEGTSIKLPRSFRKDVATSFSDRAILVTVEELVPVRSKEANGYYWAVIIPEIQEGVFDVWGYKLTPKETHELLRQRFLKVQKIDEFTGEVLVEFARSTASLKVHEFAFYLEECIQFAAEYLGVSIPPPAQKKGEYKFAEFRKPGEDWEKYKSRIAGYLEEIETREELDRYFNFNGDWNREPEIRALFGQRWEILGKN